MVLKALLGDENTKTSVNKDVACELRSTGTVEQLELDELNGNGERKTRGNVRNLSRWVAAIKPK